MFSHICKTYYPLFFLVVHMYPVWCGLHDTLIPLDSTYASPGPPKMKTKIEKNVHQITSIFYILLSFGVILRCLWGLEAYIYIMFRSSVDQCILIWGDRGIHLRLRATEQSSYITEQSVRRYYGFSIAAAPATTAAAHRPRWREHSN